MSLVSIIIPVYNTSAYLRKCVDSVLKQTYRPLEILLVDDGSTDDSSRLCDAIEVESDSIHVIHKENGGLSSARLSGFEEANGEYVLFVDSDDYIEPAMVEKLMAAMEKNKADLAICGYFQVDSGVTTNHLLPYTTETLEDQDDIVKNYVQPLTGKSSIGINIPGFLWIRLLKRSLIQRSFFASENKYFAEDHVFDLLYSDHVKRIAIVNEPLYDYVIHNSSLTNKYRRHKTEMLHNLFFFYEDFLSARRIPYEEDRRSSFLRSLVFSSVDNAVLSGSYMTFLGELNQLLEKGDVSIYGQIPQKNLSFVEKVTWWLLKHRLFKILYNFRKWRIDAARLRRKE